MNDPRTDEALFRAFAGGDARAFDVLFARHGNWLHRVIVRQTGDTYRADDIFQETWLAAIRNAASWTEQARWTTWIYRIARSKLIDSVRRAQPDWRAAALYRGADEDEDPIDSIADLRFEPASQHERLRLVEHLAAGIEQLPPEQREVFILWAEAQMPVPELAVAVDAPVETVKSRLRYARGKLARWMKDWQS
jgi:RNA polymerase sigma factor (sigma-70 family)